MPQAPRVWGASLAEDVCCPLRAELLEGGSRIIGGHIDNEVCCRPGLGTVDLLGETLGGSLGTVLGIFSLEAGGGSSRGWLLSQQGSSSLVSNKGNILEVEQEAREDRGWSFVFALSLH